MLKLHVCTFNGTLLGIHKVAHFTHKIIGLGHNSLPIPDINECTAGTDNCDTNAHCINTPGSFTCACNQGYSGNGVTCTGMYYTIVVPMVLCRRQAGFYLMAQVRGWV